MVREYRKCTFYVLSDHAIDGVSVTQIRLKRRRTRSSFTRTEESLLTTALILESIEYRAVRVTVLTYSSNKFVESRDPSSRRTRLVLLRLCLVTEPSLSTFEDGRDPELSLEGPILSGRKLDNHVAASTLGRPPFAFPLVIVPLRPCNARIRCNLSKARSFLPVSCWDRAAEPRCGWRRFGWAERGVARTPASIERWPLGADRTGRCPVPMGGERKETQSSLWRSL